VEHVNNAGEGVWVVLHLFKQGWDCLIHAHTSHLNLRYRKHMHTHVVLLFWHSGLMFQFTEMSRHVLYLPRVMYLVICHSH
jgi:hypothetical protein